MRIKNIVVTTLTVGLAMLSLPLFANIQKNSSPIAKPFFIILGTGYSFSKNANISVQQPVWDPAVEGYNSTVGNTALYTAGAGYRFSPLIDVDVEVNYRPSYSYNKFQTPISSTASAKTRKFDLSNATAMANIMINGHGANLFANVGPQTILQPFIGAGIGISYNTVSNFHSVLVSSTLSGFSDVSAVMNAQTQTAFAWQFLVGLELLKAETWGVDLGYRYFDGGNFKSNNYFSSAPSGATQPLAVSPWTGHLTANEVFLNVRYFLA